MKSYSKKYVTTLMGMALFFMICLVGATVQATPQEQEEQAEPEYTEEEYNAYEAATKEADLLKRGEMLLAFVEKYPESKLMPYINAEYNKLLHECSEVKKYDQLESLAESWLKLHPGDMNTLLYIAAATQNLGKLERCVECMEEIYLQKPDPGLARDIFNNYVKTSNLAKQIEWAEKMFKMPEFDADFGLRWDFVKRYMESGNYPKAAEYAQLTLKSAALVKQPDANTQETLRMVHRACHHVIGMDLMEKDKFEEAIRAFRQALRSERYDVGYFSIGQCLENQQKVEEAMVEYAKAELQGGELAPKAKERLELLYKALHNDTTIGIDKKYKQAKEELANEEVSDARLN
ncbi:MAG: hypothetical protein GXX84_19820 [Acidobacteria bacterium]|nr:hypothetical protein [Acidobacteriota bacterium]